MQSEERELITGLFGRLQPFESQPRDGEAEALIKDLAARQPAAPYLLVQTVLVQEQALKAAQERIAELEARAGAAPAASGFLGSAPKIGPWGATAGAPAHRRSASLRAVDTLAPAGRGGAAARRRRRLPAHGNGDRGRRRGRRAAVRRHPQPDGQQSRAVRTGGVGGAAGAAVAAGQPAGVGRRQSRCPTTCAARTTTPQPTTTATRAGPRRLGLSFF